MKSESFESLEEGSWPEIPTSETRLSRFGFLEKVGVCALDAE